MALTAFILLLAPAATPPAAAQEPEPETESEVVDAAPVLQPRGASAAGEPRAAGADAFAALQKEFEDAYQAAIDDYLAQREAGAEHPSFDPPFEQYYPRFAEFARNGVVDARLWCLQHLNYGDVPEDEQSRYLREEAMDLALHHAGHPKIIALARRLTYAVGDRPGQISLPVACGILELITLKAPEAETRAAALMARATAVQRAGEAERAQALYRTLVEEYPETDSGKSAQGQIFALENLQVGMTAPNFSGTDVDGNALALEDYRGRVVLVDFWGFW